MALHTSLPIYRVAYAGPFCRSVARYPNDEQRYAWPDDYRDIAVSLAWHLYQSGYRLALEHAARECDDTARKSIAMRDEYSNGRFIGAEDCAAAIRKMAEGV